MVGLGGDDIYYMRNATDRVVEARAAATTACWRGASYTLEAGSEVEIFTTIDNLATTAINLTGNELAQYLYGNAGANMLDGKGGADVLTGLGGADMLRLHHRARRAAMSTGSPISRGQRQDPARRCGVHRRSRPVRSTPSAFVAGTPRPTATTGSSTTAPPASSSTTPTAAARARQVLFATLDTHPAITATDFQVI